MNEKICCNCGCNSILINKWKLCNSCYTKFRKSAQFKHTKTVDQKKIYKTNLIIERYGTGLFKDMELSQSLHSITLRSIGDKYGISRERVRQLYKYYYGKSWREGKGPHKQEHDIGCEYDPKQKMLAYDINMATQRTFIRAQIEVELLNKCKSFNFPVTIIPSQRRRFIINGFSSIMYIATKASVTTKCYKNPMRYYRLVINDSTLYQSDFLIFAIYNNDLQTFYTFPFDYWKDKRSIYVPARETRYRRKNNVSKCIAEYQEGWQLFKT